jgi:tRNA(adenine34) deaminase
MSASSGAVDATPSEASSAADASEPVSPDLTSADLTSTDLTSIDLTYMERAVAQAEAALLHDDVPVGAIVVHGTTIIAARHNERELTGDPSAHAEVLALREAADHVGSWRLDECTLYVTLEPCAMCAGAMVNARLGRVVYGTADPKAGAVDSHFHLLDGAVLNHRVEVTADIDAVRCGDLLRAFFRSRRS